MEGQDTKEFYKPFDVKDFLGPQQQSLYHDLVQAKRRELIKQGGPKNVTNEEKKAIAERIKGMSLTEFQRTQEEVSKNKPKELPRQEESQYKGFPKPKEPTTSDYQKFNSGRGNFNVDLTAKDD